MGKVKQKNPSKIPLRQATSCFLIKDNQVLLAMKKRGFGMGKWNGPGGKPNPGENIEETAVRETFEEIGVTIKTFERVATLDFLFSSDKEKQGWNQQVCVFLVDSWEGEPAETEEMKPEWFNFDEIPYKDMWADDIHWLPQVLKGKKLVGTFTFDKDENLQDIKVIEI